MTRISPSTLARYQAASYPVESVEPRSTPGMGGKSKQPYGRLTGPLIAGVFGDHRHRWQWCGSWSQWVSRCGIGKYGKPGDDGRVRECERCKLEEVG